MITCFFYKFSILPVRHASTVFGMKIACGGKGKALEKKMTTICPGVSRVNRFDFIAFSFELYERAFVIVIFIPRFVSILDKSTPKYNKLSAGLTRAAVKVKILIFSLDSRRSLRYLRSYDVICHYTDVKLCGTCNIFTKTNRRSKPLSVFCPVPQ